jgi:hypothetical protein
MHTLRSAVLLYADLTITNGGRYCWCRVNLCVVPKAERFCNAGFVAAWRRWFSTPITTETVN